MGKVGITKLIDIRQVRRQTWSSAQITGQESHEGPGTVRT